MVHSGRRIILSELTVAEAKLLNNKKNILRGLIGQARKGRPGEVSDNHFRRRQEDPYDVFVVGLRMAFIDARNTLPSTLFGEYFEWAHDQLAALGWFQELPARFKALDGVFDAKALTGEDEFSFVSHRLKPYDKQIVIFESFRRHLTTTLVSGNESATFELMGFVEAGFGQSLWFHELSLAVRQHFEGLESQKRYSESVRMPLRRAIYSYVVRQASVRNEPSTTWQRFKDDLVPRIDSLSLSEHAKSLIKNRLFGDEFNSTEDALRTLAAAQSFPVPDLYNATLNVATWATRSPSGVDIQIAARQWLDALDHRIAALSPPVDGSIPDHGKREATRALAWLAEDRIDRAYRVAMRALRAGHISVPILAVVALSISEGRRKPHAYSDLQKTIVSDLSHVASGDDGWAVSASSARKLTQNFAGLPLFQNLRLIVDFLAQPTLEAAPPAFSALFPSLASPPRPDLSTSASPFAAFAEAVAAIDRGDHSNAIVHLEIASRSPSRVATRIANTLLIHLAARQGNIVEAVERLAREAARVPEAAAALPALSVLPNPRWPDLKPHADKLFISIALDIHWRATRNDRSATVRRFAFNEFLRLRGVRRPTALRTISDQFDLGELIYFLQNVCVSNVMDMSSFFGTLAEVEDELINIQLWLAELDPERRHEYDAKRLELTNNRAIHDGLRIVDSSRIHVDTDAVRAWAYRESAEYFSRYTQLVDIGIGASDNLVDLIQQISSPDGSVSIDPPLSEADTILIEQTLRIREQFLHNSEHGLDSYLSRRVRHHPLTATLRSPVEFANLITTRETEFGEYRENAHWLDCLGLSAEYRAETSAAFREFAAEFDGILTDLKDERFHVRTPEKPNGLFDVDLLPIHHHILRAVVQLDLSIDTYISEAIGIFSALLEASLTVAREYLNGPIKEQVSAAFDKLRARLDASAIHSLAFSDLATACGDAAAEVQRKLFEVSEWLSREEGHALQKTFTLRQVLEIGVRAALDPYKEYQPEIQIDTDGDLEMPATNVALVSEFLLVILNNARLHGKILRGQKVYITCSPDLKARTITLRVTSGVGAEARTAAVERKVAELATAIKSGKFDRGRVRREGNSGFVKIASIVTQSKDGKLDFGFLGPGEFFVEVVYSIIVLREGEPP